MNIIFEKVHIHNFFSFSDTTINLNDKGYVLVCGNNNNPKDNSASNGSGKCFAEGTKVLMWDGTCKNVENIRIGDVVMGWDSTPRVVLETHYGESEMFEVSSARNQYSYKCNGEHILCLKKTISERMSPDAPDELEISVNEWLKLPESWKRNYCQYIKSVDKFYENPLSKMKLDPYFLGIWLGDGTSTMPSITSMDEEIVNFLYDYLKEFPQCHISTTYKPNTKCKTYRFSVGQRTSGGARNPIMEALRYYDLISNKHIPLEYMTSNRENRLRLLAGLIDSDGHLSVARKTIKSTNEVCEYHSYELAMRENQLSTDIIRLARNLGFKVTKSYKNVCVHKGKINRYIRIRIYGDISDIPVILPRKKAPVVENRKRIFGSLHPVIKSVGTGKYYGFQITGDGKFLLDNCLVVHNSSIWESIVWSLTGTTIRGTKNVKNIYTDDGTYVELWFKINDIDYYILRSKDSKEYKTNLKIVINGKDVSGKGIRDSEKILSEYLPELTSELLGSVVVLGQGLPQRFTNNTPSGRKDILEKLSQSDFMIEDVKKRVNTRSIELNKEYQELSDKKIKYETTISTLRKQIEKDEYDLDNMKDIDVLNSQLEDYQKQKTEKEVVIQSLDDFIQYANNSIKEVEDKKTELILGLNKAIEEKTSDIVKQEAELSTKKVELETNIKFIKTEIQRLKSISDICPTCGQKLIGVEKPDISAKEQEYSDLCNELCNNDLARGNLSKERQKIIKDINFECEDKLNECQGIIDEYTSRKEQYEEQKIDTKKDLNVITSLINQLNAEIISYNTVKENCESRILENKNCIIDYTTKNNHNDEEIENVSERRKIINQIETFIKRDFRGILLSNVITFIDKKVKEFSKIVFDNENIDFKLDGNNISIVYNNREYENLSGGEKQKIDAIIQFALRDMMCQFMNFSSNMLVVDEIFDSLDFIGCQKIIELISSRLNDVGSIYIVTHRKDLSIPYDCTLVVNKDENGLSTTNDF